MEFWRVLNYHSAAADPSANGHPLYIRPRQGPGRIDDPDRDYLVLYVGDSPEGAIAEAFGSYSTWRPEVLDPPPGTPAGTVKALVKYEGDPAILDLDDPGVLQDWSLRPSSVVSRDRQSTQQWARSMYDTGDYAGLSWWSVYEPRWASYGLWDVSSLSVMGRPEVLTLSHPAVQDAAALIRRVIS
ncbi:MULTISPECIES: RES family NAD+ phosphorylase [Arthrobacter]|uniref:RES domain-containing protein n=1 Tax=Arthrobacter terricola TaxID=2547396 RepID=A0A4R5KQ62_9MICC|nr:MULTISPECIES: RES family NAD+ phosphorylase [Arthrobacter]MBT8160966.1 RES family NAD+ phosphorylase [Arthrobacter sp. GN70]TDF96830.1 RES domain-containing protein [Arthrobacter terricola]